jgi:hypothetical protein
LPSASSWYFHDDLLYVSARCGSEPPLPVCSSPSKSAAEVGGSLEGGSMRKEGVRVVDDVVLEVEVLLDRVVHEAAEERDVGSRAQGHVDVRHALVTSEARIDVDDLGPALLGLHHHWKATG